jgi:opacity protein-like surface antigen
MRTFILAIGAALLVSGTAAAQGEAPAATASRADFHAVIGWQNLRQDRGGDTFDSFNNWTNGIFYGGAGAGWYWTEHVKTQVDFGAGTLGRSYRYRQVTINGVATGESSRVATRQQSVAVSQQYQFFRNQWFHPHLGAGLDIARETKREEFQPIFIYDQVTRTSRQVSPARTEGPSDDMIVRPFAEVGFKAYMTRRAFFTGDTRLMFRGGIDEVLFRIGFCVDF